MFCFVFPDARRDLLDFYNLLNHIAQIFSTILSYFNHRNSKYKIDS